MRNINVICEREFRASSQHILRLEIQLQAHPRPRVRVFQRRAHDRWLGPECSLSEECCVSLDGAREYAPSNTARRNGEDASLSQVKGTHYILMSVIKPRTNGGDKNRSLGADFFITDFIVLSPRMSVPFANSLDHPNRKGGIHFSFGRKLSCARVQRAWSIRARPLPLPIRLL